MFANLAPLNIIGNGRGCSVFILRGRPLCFFRDDERLRANLEEDSIEGALAKQRYKRTARTKLENLQRPRGQLVATYGRRKRESRIRPRKGQFKAQGKLAEFKIVMATMSRNIRALLFDQDLCDFGVPNENKGMSGQENMVSKYLQKQEFGKGPN